MKQKFLDTVTVCAGILSFTTGTIVFGAGVLSLIDSRTATVAQVTAAAQQTRSAAEEGVGFKLNPQKLLTWLK